MICPIGSISPLYDIVSVIFAICFGAKSSIVPLNRIKDMLIEIDRIIKAIL